MSDFGSPFADQLTIQTPEQVDLKLPLASVGSRLLAVLTDSLLQLAAIVALLILLFLVALAAPKRIVPQTAQPHMDSAAKWVIAGFILIQFLLIWGYFSLFEAFWNGQTPGKRLLKIRVIQDSGRPITLFESLARNLLRVIDMLPSIYLVGLVTILCNRQAKRLGDLLAGTLVVHESALPRGRGTSSSAYRLITPTPAPAFVAPASAQQRVPADALARLTPSDLQVLEVFFTRNLDLPLAVRHSMAAAIATRLGEKMHWSRPDAASHPERMLEAILFTARDR